VADDVVETNVLKADLLYSLLEIYVIKDLESVSVDKKHGVSFNLSVARLHQAFIPGFLASLISIEPQILDSLHFVLPFLANHLQQALRAYVISNTPRYPTPQLLLLTQHVGCRLLIRGNIRAHIAIIALMIAVLDRLGLPIGPTFDLSHVRGYLPQV
jgi:hypothetical protein